MRGLFCVWYSLETYYNIWNTDAGFIYRGRVIPADLEAKVIEVKQKVKIDLWQHLTNQLFPLRPVLPVIRDTHMSFSFVCRSRYATLVRPLLLSFHIMTLQP